MPANPLEYNKKGPHSFEWGLLVAEGGFEPPKALLRCPSHCSLMRRTRRPLRQILLPTSATGGGRRICPGLTLRSKVQPPFYSKKQSPDQKVEGLFLVAEGGFEPPKALLRCPSHCSLMRRTRRPLRQILLPTSATGGGRRICPGLSLRAPCGARKNLRAIRPLDFFDRCANALLAVSAAGGARGRFPTSHARRSHNPEL